MYKLWPYVLIGVIALIFNMPNSNINIKNFTSQNLKKYINELQNIDTFSEVDKLYHTYLQQKKDIHQPINRNELHLLHGYRYSLKKEKIKREEEIRISACKMFEQDIDKYTKQNPSDVDQLYNLASILLRYKDKTSEFGCTNAKLPNDTLFEDIKKQIIAKFIEENTKDFCNVNLSIKDINTDIKNIATNYAEEIQGFHPIADDSEVANDNLIKPFQIEVAKYINKINSKVNKQILIQTKNILEEFTVFCDEHDFFYMFNEEDIPVYNFLGYDSTQYNNNFKEEGRWKSIADEALNWVPVVGDVKEVLGLSVNNETHNKKNAETYMKKKIESLNLALKGSIKDHTKITIINLSNYLVKSLSIKEY